MQAGTDALPEGLDTTEAFRRAMQVLRDAGVPESLWPTALPLALADIRGVLPPSPPLSGVHDGGEGRSATSRASKAKAKRRKASPQRGATSVPSASDIPSILTTLPDEATLFDAVHRETEVSIPDLADLFHVEAGALHIKVPSKDLGSSKKAATQTITALVAGLVFAGTRHRKLSFKEVADICRAKHVFDSGNSAASIRSTPSFGSVGAGPTSGLVTKTGWQEEFRKAVQRALKNPTVADG